MNNLAPYIHTPLSIISGGFNTCQRSRQCRDFELRYMHCLEAYGKLNGEVKCIDYKDDLMECANGFKSVARYNEMRVERMKQYYRGKRDKMYDEEISAEVSYI